MSILTLEITLDGTIKNVNVFIDGVKTDLTGSFRGEITDAEIYECIKARCIEIGYPIS